MQLASGEGQTGLKPWEHQLRVFSDPTSRPGEEQSSILWLCFCWERMRFSFLLGPWDAGTTPALCW